MCKQRDVVVPRGAEVERMIVIGADRVIGASRDLGVPGQGREPRYLQTWVLESLLSDRVSDHDRRLDERKRMRVEKAMLPESSSKLPQLELDRLKARVPDPYLFRIDRVVRKEDDVARERPIRIHDRKQADLRLVELQPVRLR